jgi:hypothetical protein
LNSGSRYEHNSRKDLTRLHGLSATAGLTFVLFFPCFFLLWESVVRQFPKTYPTLPMIYTHLLVSVGEKHNRIILKIQFLFVDKFLVYFAVTRIYCNFLLGWWFCLWRRGKA